MNVPFIEYKGMREFYTIREVCQLFHCEKDELKQACKSMEWSPDKMRSESTASPGTMSASCTTRFTTSKRRRRRMTLGRDAAVDRSGDGRTP